MASDTHVQVRPRLVPPLGPWPPHDTEESVLGTDLHQTTITNLRWGINEAAHRLVRGGGGSLPLPWQALSQIALLGCVRPDGSAYRTFPDVFVYAQPIDPQRGSVTLEVDGPPVLVVEVLSEATYEADVDLVQGKGYSYTRAGVAEYLTLDPGGGLLSETGRGWRLVEGVYRPWERDAEGRWQSGRIGVAIGLEGVLATVYTADGRRLLHEGEVEEELGRREEELGRREETIARQAAEIEELRRRLRELHGE